MRNGIAPSHIRSYLETHPIVNESLGLTTGKTPELYVKALIRFEDLTHIDVEILLEKVDKNEMKPRDIRTLITTSTANLSTSNRKTIDSAVRHVFSHYTTRLPKSTIKYDDNDDLRGYTKDELQRLIGYLDKPLEKLYVIIGAESGLRAETILALKWKHIQDDYNNGTDEMALKLEPSFHKGRKKSGYTFIGYRSRKLIEHCIEKGLIRTEPEANLFPYNYDRIQKIVKLAKSKNKANVNDDVEVIHGLRKFFIGQIEAPKPPIDGGYQKMMKGRFDDIDAKKYNNREFETLRPEYKHAYQYLDYMNDAPEESQKLSTKLTKLEDANKQLSERLRLTEEKLLNIKKIHTEPDLTLNEWTQKPDDQIFKDLQQLFSDIGNVIGKARAAQNIQIPSTTPKMFQLSPKAMAAFQALTEK